MASWAVLGVPTAACGGMGAVTMMSSAAASKSKKSGGGGGGGGLLDWLNGALDKESFSETDPVLQKVEGTAQKNPAAPPASAPSPKSKQSSSGSGGGGLFGIFGKK